MARPQIFSPLSVLVCVLAAWSCGCGGSSGTGGGGSLNVQPIWQQPGGGGTDVTLPSAVNIVRIVFESDAGLRCCIAVDPNAVPVDSASGLRLLLLDALPAGPATFSLSAFVTDFAPAPDGVTEACPTSPPNVGQPCDPVRPATPSFQSAPQTVTITPGTRAQAPNIQIRALPFLLDLRPAPGDSSSSPVPIAFTVVDAATGIDGSPDRINVEVVYRDKAPPFRSLTKRVPVTLSPCDDNSATPCSTQGQFQVTGFRAAGAPTYLPPGPTSLQITAYNLDSPPSSLGEDRGLPYFSYDFTVLPGDAGTTPGSTPAATPAEGPSPAAGTGGARSATHAVAGGQAAIAGTTPARAEPTRTATNTPARIASRQPTATATPTPTAVESLS
ncbi:MAG: hypothetical protein ACHQ9S_15810 [Candidatus Binatia bacterium]